MAIFDHAVERISALAARADHRLPRSPFGRVGVAQAAASAGDALVSLGLAGSLFFSLDPSAAKSKVLQYLLISLAPFVVVAPFIGPLVDRLGRVRRWVLFWSSMVRALMCIFMAGHLDSLLLFPEAFAVLVAAKTASVARQAIVPAVVPSDNDLVRANSRLSLISVLGGAVALPIGGLARRYADDGSVLRIAAVVFIAAGVLSLRIKVRRERETAFDETGAFADVVADDEAMRVNGFALMLLRATVGCVLFACLFGLRKEPLWITGLTLGSLSVGTSVGAALAERLRRRTSEGRMVLGAMVVVAVFAAGASINGLLVGAVILAACVGISASCARLAFDAIVQRSMTSKDYGATFARYETRFQLAWVIGALVPTAVTVPMRVAFGMVAGVLLAGVVVVLVGEPALDWIGARLRAITVLLRSVVGRIPVFRDRRRSSVAGDGTDDAATEHAATEHDGTERERRLVASSVSAPTASSSSPVARSPVEGASPVPPRNPPPTPTVWKRPRLSTTPRSRRRPGR